MNFEPQKFFIGLMDFFSILLPGALLTYLFMDDVGPAVLGCAKYEGLAGAEAIAAFLVTSYLAGHLIFLLASGVLDEFYDWIRRHTLNSQIVLLARRGKLLPWIVRAVLWVIFKRERNLAVGRASAIKAKVLEPLQAKDAVNTFQWCKSLLTKEHPESMVAVQRFEADSKFFRSFVIVLIILVVYWLWKLLWLNACYGFVLIFLALWRYMEQRLKSTNQAYWSVITLIAQQGNFSLNKASPRKDGLTHAGGVVFRMRAGQAEYLLVEAKNFPNERVLPKGHIEEGEQPTDAAVREVHEETGVWAKNMEGFMEGLDPVSYFVGKEAVTVKFFVMEYVARGFRNSDEVNRKRYWLPLDAAKNAATYSDAKNALELAGQIVAKQIHVAPPAT